ncbi:MAG: nucleoside hydrolase [Sphaerobacteraceae bacterium]|nr:MAG: nucleoside hydrolase [Sphaerobacteraceae bacterium]
MMADRIPTPVLMDVDTGVDDAMALALAWTTPQIELVGVTTVAGNVTLDQATTNTLRVLNTIGATDLPVYRGMNRPLVRDHFDAAHFHGNDGLGGAKLPDRDRSVEAMTAPEFIVQSARNYQGSLTLCFVGPLTNLAVALSLAPDLPQLVDRVVIMGGAFQVPGNATPTAEFNIAVDPEAADQIARSNFDVTWIGLDVTHSTKLYSEEWKQMSDAVSGGTKIVRDVCRQAFVDRAEGSMHLHDPLAVGVVLDQSLVEVERAPVQVDTSVRTTAGATRMMKSAARPDQNVAIKVDSRRFRQMFGRLLNVPIDDRE